MQKPSTKFNLKLPSFGVPSTLITLLLVPLFVYLGYWQFNRFSEKNKIQLELESRINEPTMIHWPLSEDLSTYRYRQLQISGQFLNEHNILLENQIFKGQVGYHVLTPFLVDKEDKICLIDRGFIPQGKTRQDLPPIPAISGKISITAILNFPSRKLQLKENAIEFTSWPLRVSNIDLRKLSKIFSSDLCPFILQLNPKDPYGFAIPPLTIPVPASRHLAYAIQWFIMAIAVFIYYLFINIRHAR